MNICWYVGLNKESASFNSKMENAVNNDRHVENFNLQESICTEEEDVIFQKRKWTMKNQVATGLFTMVQDLLDEVLRTLFQDPGSSIRPVESIVIEGSVVSLLWKDVFLKTLYI